MSFVPDVEGQTSFVPDVEGQTSFDPGVLKSISNPVENQRYQKIKSPKPSKAQSSKPKPLKAPKAFENL
jgi:hypothetical protein